MPDAINAIILPTDQHGKSADAAVPILLVERPGTPYRSPEPADHLNDKNSNGERES